MSDTSQDIRAVREQLVHGLLVATSIAGFPPMALSFYRSFVLDSPALRIALILIYGILLATTLLRRRIPYRASTFLIFGLLIGAAGVGLSLYATMSGALLWLMVLVVLSSLVFGARGGMLAVFTGAAMLVVFGRLTTNGTITFAIDADEYIVSNLAWTASTVFFLFSAGSVVLLLRYVYEAMLQSIGDLQASTEELNRSNERLSAEMAEREKAERQLHQAQKMDAIGRLAGGIAHDFNNLLHAITGFTDIAISELEEQSSAREHLAEVGDTVERAADLVDQLLTFSRDDSGPLKELRLEEVVEDLATMLRRIITANVPIEFTHEPDIRPIRADKGRIEQTLVNLCINARDAMPNGGAISIQVRNVHLDQEFCS